MRKLLLCLSLAALMSCKGSNTLRDNIKTGAAIGAEACQWIEEATDAGAVIAVCATLAEIAKFGKHPARILHARGVNMDDAEK